MKLLRTALALLVGVGAVTERPITGFTFDETLPVTASRHVYRFRKTNDAGQASPEGFVPPPNVSMETQVAIVSPKYFATLQLPLEKGRDFTEQDSKESQRVVIVNQTFAERYWPGQEPIGKQVVSDLTNESFTVVGIARNAK